LYVGSNDTAFQYNVLVPAGSAIAGETIQSFEVPGGVYHDVDKAILLPNSSSEGIQAAFTKLTLVLGVSPSTLYNVQLVNGPLLASNPALKTCPNANADAVKNKEDRIFLIMCVFLFTLNIIKKYNIHYIYLKKNKNPQEKLLKDYHFNKINSVFKT